MDGWIEQAQQRAGELIAAGAELPAVTVGLALAAVAGLLLVTALLLQRRRGGAARGRSSYYDGTGGRQRTGGSGDLALRAVVLVAETMAAFRTGASADVLVLKRAARIEEQGRHLFHAVNALLRLSKGWSRSARAIESALTALGKGDTAPAVRVLGSLAEAMAAKSGGDPVSGAQLFRHLAAVAFLRAPETALAPARRATELAANLPQTWSLLGIVAWDRADYALARDACEAVLRLGVGVGDQGLLAGAVGTLGEVHLVLGDLERAEEAFRIALTHQAGLARPEGMVRHYRGLAQVEMARGDWARAAAIIDKALALEVSLGNREGMADLELQAGLIAERRDDLPGAFSRWTKARQLFEATGAADKVKALEHLIARAMKDKAGPGAGA
ncbi:MAG: hypothetical protein WCO00_15020 [Rhodospirillaceae bacterium]